jgi:hypothetical protein
VNLNPQPQFLTGLISVSNIPKIVNESKDCLNGNFMQVFFVPNAVDMVHVSVTDSHYRIGQNYEHY